MCALDIKVFINLHSKTINKLINIKLIYLDIKIELF